MIKRRMTLSSWSHCCHRTGVCCKDRSTLSKRPDRPFSPDTLEIAGCNIELERVLIITIRRTLMCLLRPWRLVIRMWQRAFNVSTRFTLFDDWHPGMQTQFVPWLPWYDLLRRTTTRQNDQTLRTCPLGNSIGKYKGLWTCFNVLDFQWMLYCQISGGPELFLIEPAKHHEMLGILNSLFLILTFVQCNHMIRIHMWRWLIWGFCQRRVWCSHKHINCVRALSNTASVVLTRLIPVLKFAKFSS